MNWLSGSNHLDHTAKLEENLEQLASADYLTVASNRSYGVIPRLPIHYPTTNTYYDLLFAGELGFEIVYIVDRSPNLGGVYIVPDTFAWPNLDRPDEVTDYF